ncbi:ninjurin-1 isoform X4 [Cebus imitator]|uniref:ninjurin-1 isoform X4 n=1 Tax=Cebus imitator TaxID=2715852 RepID=UPI00189B332A|nr:ninjurin-1 isoform X4 [Cebus imitator]
MPPGAPATPAKGRGMDGCPCPPLPAALWHPGLPACIFHESGNRISQSGPQEPPRWGWRHRPINVNHYANKKSAAESMLDIALLMANASQLKAVVEQGPSFAFYVPLVVLISISLALQIGVGVLLIFLGPWMPLALQLSCPTPGAAVPVRCPPCCTWHSPDCQSPGWPHLHHVPGPALALTVADRHGISHSCLLAAVPRRQLPPGT